jgi:hypothetical protein
MGGSGDHWRAISPLANRGTSRMSKSGFESRLERRKHLPRPRGCDETQEGETQRKRRDAKEVGSPAHDVQLGSAISGHSSGLGFPAAFRNVPEQNHVASVIRTDFPIQKVSKPYFIGLGQHVRFSMLKVFKTKNLALCQFRSSLGISCEDADQAATLDPPQPAK